MGLKNHLWIKMKISYKNLIDETMKSMNDSIISKLELEYCLAESTHTSINSLKLNSFQISKLQIYGFGTKRGNHRLINFTIY